MIRGNNRGHEQLRPVVITRDYLDFPLGSAMIETGRTKVLCTISMEAKQPDFLKGTNSGWVTAEYSMLPGSTLTRSPREASRGKQGGRTMEIQRLIGRALRATMDMEALGPRTLWVDCDALQADGGTRTASISGASVALFCALESLIEQKVIERMPMQEPVAAVSVGIVGGDVLLDLDYNEDHQADVDMTLAMTGSGNIIEVQASAEGRPFKSEEFDSMLSLAKAGIKELIEIQDISL